MCKNMEPGSTQLWDEILKAIVDTMPEQLFPLFKEVYGKEYPKGTPIVLLSTESSTYLEAPDAPPHSRLSDIALLVNGTDYYHIECQMHNEHDMVIRMIAYDLHFAMQHTTSEDQGNGGFVMRFPRSTVIYPAKNSRLPEFLQCRVIFQDGSEHIYQIPTVRIQSYSMEEIHEKHLTIFIPYVLLRLRPKLNPARKHPLSKKELTAFVENVIFILKDELNKGYLTIQQFDDYINLFRLAAEKIFESEKHSGYRKEVDLMTKPLIELPSVLQKRLLAEIEQKNALLAEREAELAQKNAELTQKDTELAQKDSELAWAKNLLSTHHILTTPH